MRKEDLILTFERALKVDDGLMQSYIDAKILSQRHIDERVHRFKGIINYTIFNIYFYDREFNVFECETFEKELNDILFASVNEWCRALEQQKEGAENDH